MTRDELKKEAEEYTETKGKEHFRKFYNSDKNIAELITQVYIDSAEPREKEIKSLGERCLQLQKDKGELTDRVRELEAQIEKMKSCINCRYCINEKCPWQPKGCGMKHWELRR